MPLSIKPLDFAPILNTLHWMSVPVSGVQKYQQHLWPCLLLILLTLAIRTPFLGIPFERDEGEYAYIGWRLEHHELPYRDWVDQKPPAIFWVYRLAFFLPLDPVRAVHFVGLLFHRRIGLRPLYPGATVHGTVLGIHFRRALHPARQ